MKQKVSVNLAVLIKFDDVIKPVIHVSKYVYIILFVSSHLGQNFLNLTNFQNRLVLQKRETPTGNFDFGS